MTLLLTSRREAINSHCLDSADTKSIALILDRALRPPMTIQLTSRGARRRPWKDQPRELCRSRFPFLIAELAFDGIDRACHSKDLEGSNLRTADPNTLPRILDVAEQLFARQSFSDVRMEDVAAKAQVAKGTLYLHFANKESLFRAMAANVSGRFIDDSQERLAKVKDVRQQLRIIVRQAVEFSAQYPHYLETLHLLDSSPVRDADIEIRQRRERLFCLIERLLQDAHRSGELSVPHPQRSVLALLGMLHRVLYGTPQPWPEDIADWVTDQFLHGVSKTPS
jgi:TetR/AcrR family transcriptional regulator